MQFTIRSVNSQFGGTDAVNLANISCMSLVQHFLAATHSLGLNWIMHLPPPLPLFYFSTATSVWQVPGSVGMGAHDWGVADLPAMEGVTLSRGWLCQKWKPLD